MDIVFVFVLFFLFLVLEHAVKTLLKLLRSCVIQLDIFVTVCIPSFFYVLVSFYCCLHTLKITLWRTVLWRLTNA